MLHYGVKGTCMEESLDVHVTPKMIFLLPLSLSSSFPSPFPFPSFFLLLPPLSVLSLPPLLSSLPSLFPPLTLPLPPLSLLSFLFIKPPHIFCRTVAMGTLGSLLLFHQGWRYVFIIVGTVGLLWALLLRSLSRRLKVNHRTHYKLAGSPHPTTRERLRLDVRPTTIMASCATVPWKKILLQPAVL